MTHFLEVGLPLGDARRRAPSDAAASSTTRPGASTSRRAARSCAAVTSRQLRRQRRQPARGHLFDADFDQQFAIHHAAAELDFSRSAGVRTRPCQRLRPLLSILGSSSRSFHVRLRNRHRQLADAQDVGGALGDADAAAAVEDVEQVRALQAFLERGPDQARRQQLLAEAVVPLEQVAVVRGELSPRRRPRPGRTRTSTARSPRGAAPRDTSRPAPTRGRRRCPPAAAPSRCARGRR